MATILLTDDDEITRYAVSVVLEREGYTVLSADPSAALEIARSHPDAIQLLITDIRMGGMDGFELARRVQEHRPGIKIIYLSGHPYPECSLLKPYRPESLVAIIEASLASMPAESFD